MAEALGVACLTASFLEEPSRAKALGEEAVEVARGVGDPRLIGWTLWCLAEAMPTRERAEPLNIEALACLRQAGDIFIASLVLLNLAWRESDVDFEAAHAHLEEAMAKMSRNEPVRPDEYYMRVSPKFDVPEGPYSWMSKHVFVGVAEKIPGANRIHYFVVR